MTDLSEYDRLDAALDALAAGRSAADVPADIAGLVGVAAELREALSYRPEDVVAELDRPRQGLRRLAVVAVAAVLGLTLLSGSAFAASAHALPGQTLYGTKLAFERVGLALHPTRHGRAAFQWMLAQRRLAELEALAGRGGSLERAGVAYEDALHRVADSLGRGDDETLAGRIEEDLTHHVAVLNGLLDKVPAQAREGIRNAIDHASQAREQVQNEDHGKDRPDDRGSSHP